MDVNAFPVLTDSDYRMPFYLTSAGEWTHQEAVYRPHGFPDFQWIQCMNGAGRLVTERGTFNVESGQGMWLMPNEQHAYEPLVKPWRVRWISLNGMLVRQTLQALDLEQTEVRYHANPERTLQKMEEALMLFSVDTPRRGAAGSALAYSILVDLNQWTQTDDPRNKNHAHEQMAPIFTFIEQHYHTPITLAQLAEQISVTAQHTCLLFRQTTGLRPFEYLTRYRLRKAKELLLQQPTLPVKQIAAKVGYEHPSYFIKLFKRQEGMTPNRFRQIYRRTP